MSFGEFFELIPPRVPTFWKPVQEEHQRILSVPILNVMQSHILHDIICVKICIIAGKIDSHKN